MSNTVMNEMEYLQAKISLNNKLQEMEKLGEEKINELAKKFEDEFSEFGSCVSDRNSMINAVAKYYNMSREELLSSPNYEKLSKDFVQDNVDKMVAFVEQSYNLTNKEARVFISEAMK